MLLSASLTSLAFQCSVPRILSLLKSEVSFDNYIGIDKINRKVVRPCVRWNNGSFFCMFFHCFFLEQKHLNIHILLTSSLRNNWEQDKTWSQATLSISGMVKYYEHPLTLNNYWMRFFVIRNFLSSKMSDGLGQLRVSTQAVMASGVNKAWRMEQCIQKWFN